MILYSLFFLSFFFFFNDTMTINYNKCILVFLLLFSLSDLINSQQLGSIQTSVPWKAGHASGLYKHTRTPYSILIFSFT